MVNPSLIFIISYSEPKKIKTVEETEKNCDPGFTCLKSEDCNYISSKLLCMIWIRDNGKTYLRIINEIKKSVCNANEKALRCPDAKRNETFNCLQKEGEAIYMGVFT